MKRCFLLFSFFLVIVSQAVNIVAGVFECNIKIEIVEKEKTEKEIDNEPDFEKDKKDKIFQSNIIPLGFLSSRDTQNPHPGKKIPSLALDTEINPPDIKVA